MGSHCNPSKRHYDITMSRRTRKPLNLQEANRQNSSSKWDIPLKTIATVLDQSSPRKGADDDEEELLDSSDRKSLKQLINGNENSKSGAGRSGASTSLGHHFTEEEKQLQLVKKQQEYNGAKLKGMMNRYAKVLRHLVKVKYEPQKKHRLRLTM